MAYLLNRNPPARFQCLHSLCKMLFSKYNTAITFRMTEVKYNPETENIHSHCDLLIENKSIGIKYCRYKENPLNTSGCSLTNGVYDDTTKSKEVSNTVNALHALGLLNRKGSVLQLTKAGALFARTEFNSKKMLDIIRDSVLRYGLFVGFMHQLYSLGKEEFDTSEIIVGYPKATEKIKYKGELITISSGSEDDSNTRTKSCILAWATTAGFICPAPLLNILDDTKPHVSSSEYILQSSRNLRKYKILFIPEYLFSGKFITERPLDYKNLTKNIGALRENNQENIRELSLKVEPKIQNRRFAVSFLLNEAFKHTKTLSIKKLVAFLLEHEDYFVIDKDVFYNTMCEEINIGFMAGIPFSIISGDKLKPSVGLNLKELSLNVPPEVLTILKKYKL